jgi:hypothetical protein
MLDDEATELEAWYELEDTTELDAGWLDEAAGVLEGLTVELTTTEELLVEEAMELLLETTAELDFEVTAELVLEDTGVLVLEMTVLLLVDETRVEEDLIVDETTGLYLSLNVPSRLYLIQLEYDWP